MRRKSPILCRKCMTITMDGACECPPPPPLPAGAPRYAVWFPKTGKYLAGDGGGLAWTRDRAEAEEMAQGGGVIVDADEFAANWVAYVNGERVPPETR